MKAAEPTPAMPPSEPAKRDAEADQDEQRLVWVCRSVLPAASPLFRNSTVHASFYPYIGMTHTIRRRGPDWVVRISDHCRKAPRAVLEAIVAILASKIMRKRPPRASLEAYDAYRVSPHLVELVRERRRSKGRKQMNGNEGRFHSLQRIYREINERYFRDQVEIRRIGWGIRRSWARLGHYDPVHHTITLSPVLDSGRVPEFVVRYIVYHEMLHTIFEGTAQGRKRHHHAEFRRAERAYPDFDAASSFLREYCSRRRS